jgi:transcriptional regulator with XRE-family HTH domain
MNNKKPDKEYKVKVGENILYWRRIKGIKQEELAKKIGISPGALSNIENGSSKPDIERIEDIAEALGVEVNHLLLHPKQFYAENNTVTDKGVHTSQSQHIDKTMLERMLLLMEKMTDFFTSKKQAD